MNELFTYIVILTSYVVSGTNEISTFSTKEVQE